MGLMHLHSVAVPAYLPDGAYAVCWKVLWTMPLYACKRCLWWVGIHGLLRVRVYSHFCVTQVLSHAARSAQYLEHATEDLIDRSYLCNSGPHTRTPAPMALRVAPSVASTRSAVRRPRSVACQASSNVNLGAAISAAACAGALRWVPYVWQIGLRTHPASGSQRISHWQPQSSGAHISSVALC